MRPLADRGSVKLEVGGVRYSASRAALTRIPQSRLARLVRDPEEGARNPEDGSFFIERDGDAFRLVLDFLQGSGFAAVAEARKRVLALAEAQREAMRAELAFYELEEVIMGPKRWFANCAFVGGPEMKTQRSGCGTVHDPVRGRVILLGGRGTGCLALKTTEVLDQAASAEARVFGSGPKLLSIRDGCGAIRLDARRALILGGWARGHFLKTTEILDLETMKFEKGPDLLTARGRCAVVAIDGGRRILVAGGEGDARSYLATTEILDLDTMTFHEGPTMAAKRTRCGAVVLGGGGENGGADARRVIVVGGAGVANHRLTTTEILNLETMRFETGPAMHSGRSSAAVVALDARRVLVAGGSDGDEPLATTEILDLDTMDFEPGPEMASPRAGAAALLVEPQTLLVAGGWCSKGILTSTEVLAVPSTGAGADAPAEPVAKLGAADMAARRAEAQGEA